MNEPNRWAEWIFILSHHCKNGRKKEEKKKTGEERDGKKRVAFLVIADIMRLSPLSLLYR